MIIAIDGAAAVGKTTIGLGVARKLGFGYFNTGSTYRALAWWCSSHSVRADDEDRVIEVARTISIAVGLHPDAQWTSVDGSDRSDDIRAERSPAFLSAVAAIPQVRELLVASQRKIVWSGLDVFPGLVVDGRDVTTVVLPDAHVKLLLVADASVRVRRRREQLGLTWAESMSDVAERDLSDSKISSFLKANSDITMVDTSSATVSETLSVVLALIDQVAGRN